jgi:hypothetical protein
MRFKPYAMRNMPYLPKCRKQCRLLYRSTRHTNTMSIHPSHSISSIQSPCHTLAYTLFQKPIRTPSCHSYHIQIQKRHSNRQSTDSIQPRQITPARALQNAAPAHPSTNSVLKRSTNAAHTATASARGLGIRENGCRVRLRAPIYRGSTVRVARKKGSSRREGLPGGALQGSPHTLPLDADTAAGTTVRPR